MTLAGFLGIPPLGHNNETDISTSSQSDIPVLINPCSGLPMLENNSMIDVGGNVFGSCGSGLGSEMFSNDNMHDPLGMSCPSLIDDTASILSCSASIEIDDFDNSMTDSFINDDFNVSDSDSWDDW